MKKNRPDDEALRKEIAASLVSLISADATEEGAIGRKIIYDAVVDMYGTQEIECRTGIRPGPCLTTEGERAYAAVRLAFWRLDQAVQTKLRFSNDH